tara:strand:- start:19431 stop:20054 length:624 start_codon:yes stop_codon:yes gene_type:complete
MNNELSKIMRSRKYKFLKRNSYQYKNYKIIPIRRSDILKIKNWRNDQINILRQTHPLSDSAQLKYFEKIVKKSFTAKKPEQILFSFILKNQCIGYGGLVHIDWEKKQTELSFLNETRRASAKKLHKQDFTIFLRLLSEIIFSELKFEKIITETYDIRSDLIKTMEEIGFVLEEKLDNHVIIDDTLHDSLLHKLDKKSYISHKIGEIK